MILDIFHHVLGSCHAQRQNVRSERAQASLCTCIPELPSLIFHFQYSCIKKKNQYFGQKISIFIGIKNMTAQNAIVHFPALFKAIKFYFSSKKKKILFLQEKTYMRTLHPKSDKIRLNRTTCTWQVWYTKDIPPGVAPISGEQIYIALVKTVPNNDIMGVQRICSLWRIYMNSYDNRVKLITKGLEVRAKSIVSSELCSGD